jgi:hypothetical protein
VLAARPPALLIGGILMSTSVLQSWCKPIGGWSTQGTNTPSKDSRNCRRDWSWRNARTLECAQLPAPRDWILSVRLTNSLEWLPRRRKNLKNIIYDLFIKPIRLSHLNIIKTYIVLFVQCSLACKMVL